LIRDISRIQRGENSVTCTIAGLAAYLSYDLYVHASGNATTQGATNTLAPANALGANPGKSGRTGSRPAQFPGFTSSHSSMIYAENHNLTPGFKL